MTDLIKEVIGPEEDLRPPSPQDVRRLETELELLDEPSYDIICFGKGDFEYLLGDLFGSLGTVDSPDGVPDILTIESELAGRDVQFYVVYSYAQGHHKRWANSCECWIISSGEVTKSGADLDQLKSALWWSIQSEE